jgi:hypothetical protein
MTGKLRGRSFYLVTSAVFTITAIVVVRPAMGDPIGTISITGAVCQPQGFYTRCNMCLVSLDPDNIRCWATKCNTLTYPGYCGCKVQTGTAVCFSDSFFSTTCGDGTMGACKAWKCGVVNAADPPAHPTAYCALGVCTCKDTGGDWTGGTWDKWRGCVCNVP